VGNRTRAGLLVLGTAVVCLAAIGGVSWYRSRALSAAALLRRLPHRDALVLYVNFDALRRAGILQMLDGSKVGEDPEYRSFVGKTQFDYKRDLDTALLSFAPHGKFLLLKGRFDWKSLDAYVKSEGGECTNSLCRMAGSAPERRISFFPVRSNLMALAVSPEDRAAQIMSAPGPAEDMDFPNAPVWFSVPGAMLKSGDALPTGTRMFARGMELAESVTLSFAPEGGRVSARLEVRCRSDEYAAEMASQLTRTTALLRQMIERERQKPNPADLSGVLASGAFRAENRRVLGYWPLERAFIDNALGGQ
jgi:hypothetical protein